MAEIAVAVAAFLIGFAKAGVAGSLGPFITVTMVLAMPADDAIGVLLPMLMAGDAFSVAAYWRKWDAAALRPLVVGALVGIGLGTVVLAIVDVEWLERVIGAVMILFVLAYTWMRRPQFSSEAAARFGGAAGVASGFTSALAHLGGPPVIVYLMAKKVTPVTLVASTAVFFAVVNAVKVPGYLLAGIFDADLIISTLWAWVFIPVGVLVGRRMVDRIDRDRFELALLVLLVIGAIALLVR